MRRVKGKVKAEVDSNSFARAYRRDMTGRFIWQRFLSTDKPQ